MVIEKEETNGDPVLDDIMGAIREYRPSRIFAFRAGGKEYSLIHYVEKFDVRFDDVDIIHDPMNKSVIVTIKGHLFQVFYNVEYVEYTYDLSW